MNAGIESKTIRRATPAKTPARSATAAHPPSLVPWLAAWQQQLVLGLRLLQASVGAAGQLHDAQLSALKESIARCTELHRQLLSARSPFDVWGCHCNWMLDGTTRALSVWKSALDAAGRANAILSQGDRP